jgi:transposase
MRLLCAVHTQLRASVILIWDNLNHHVSAVMRQFVADHNWLTVVQLPAYAPELNPTGGVWAHVKRGLGNLAACRIDQLHDRANPAQEHPVPARTHRRLHRRDRPGNPAPTSMITLTLSASGTRRAAPPTRSFAGSKNATIPTAQTRCDALLSFVRERIPVDRDGGACVANGRDVR